MPALSPTMVEGNLAKWHKKEGDKIKSGDIIAEIETDKATMEVEAADSGILGKIVIPDKTEKVAVNQLIGIILEAGDDKSAIDKLLKEHSQAPTTPTSGVKNEPIAPKESINIANQNGASSRIFASPLAKKIASTKNIDLSRIQGSGPRGRIIKDDVLNAGNTTQQNYISRNPNEFQVMPNSQMRKVIAQRLQQSKQTIPHFYMSMDCDVTYLLQLKEGINNKAAKQNPPYKISLNDLIIKATAQSLKAIPKVNASWSDEGINYYNNIDISFAVATDDGLITPIIKNADLKTLSAISNETKELASRAKKNELKPVEFQGGTFTISNLGMYNIKEFQAIINPPQSCILAVGGTEKRALVKNDQIVIASVMTISISCDHRVIDGIVAAQFIAELKQYLENPAMMLI